MNEPKPPPVGGFDIADPGLVWAGIAWQIKQGRFPIDEDLAEAIREAAIPPDLWDYVAGRVDGTISRRSGNPGRDHLVWAAKCLSWGIQVRYRQARYKRLKFKRTPRRVNKDLLRPTKEGFWLVKEPRVLAIKKVAKRVGKSASHVEKELKLLMASKYGYLLPSVEETLNYLEPGDLE